VGFTFLEREIAMSLTAVTAQEWNRLMGLLLEQVKKGATLAKRRRTPDWDDTYCQEYTEYMFRGPDWHCTVQDACSVLVVLRAELFRQGDSQGVIQCIEPEEEVIFPPGV